MSAWRVLSAVVGDVGQQDDFHANEALQNERAAAGIVAGGNCYYSDRGEAEAMQELLAAQADRNGLTGGINIHLCAHAAGGPGAGPCTASTKVV